MSESPIHSIALIFTYPLTRQSEAEMRKRFDKRRMAGTLSLVHDETHVMSVAKHGAVVAWSLAEALGMNVEFRMRVAYMTALAGVWHDIERDMREDKKKPTHGPDSARAFREWSESGTDLAGFEKAVVSEAIEHHEGSFGEKIALFGDPVESKASWDRAKPSFAQESHCQAAILNQESETQLLRSIVGISLKIADGCLEASGWRVVERRCFFVGRERILNGDLKGILAFPQESDLAVIGESFVRLYGKLAIADYPKWLRPLGESLHAVQYRFLFGLLCFRGWDEMSAVRELRARAFTGIDDGLVAKVGEQLHLSGDWFKPNEFPVLAGELDKFHMSGRSVVEQMAFASRRTVDLIAGAGTPEEGIEALREFCSRVYGHRINYSNGGEPALPKFLDGITDYRNAGPEFTRQLHEQITGGVRTVME